MQETYAGQRPIEASTAPTCRGKPGHYLYCVAPVAEEASLGRVGIEGSPVYAVVRGGLGVLVHDCPLQPYQARDHETASAWVLAHHRVVDTAWKRWDTVLPFAFNTIIASGEATAQDSLAAWLEREHRALGTKLETLAGKAEYGVQVFWDASKARETVAQSTPEITRLEEELRQMPRGLAYMHRQRLESLLRREVEARVAQEYESLHARIRNHVRDIRIEKAKNSEEGSRTLMNLSCLVSPERYVDLKAELEEIERRAGFSVRLVGPLPPYSFC